jgi:hypothetical protein
MGLPPTVGLIELFWTLPAWGGLIRYGQRWSRYWHERNYQRLRWRSTTDPKVKLRAMMDCDMANVRCVRFAFLTFVFWTFSWIGAIALLNPQGPLNADALMQSILLLAAEISLFAKGEILDGMESAMYQKVIKILAAKTKKG